MDNTVTDITCSCCNKTVRVEAFEDDEEILFFLPESWYFNDKTKEFSCPEHSVIHE